MNYLFYILFVCFFFLVWLLGFWLRKKGFTFNQKYIYYIMVACLAVLIIDTAWSDGVNMELFKLIFGMWLYERFVHCQMFHSKCNM